MQKSILDNLFKLAIDIKKWHIKTFPKVDITEQFLKVEEEMGEFEQTPNMEEFSDIFIALSALAYRHESILARKYLRYLMIDISRSKYSEYIFKGIVHKFEVDKIRRFEKKGKVYRHIEEKK